MKAVALHAFCEEIRQAGPMPLGKVPGGSRSIIVNTSWHSMQFVREFAKLGLTRSVGGVLGLALSRELTPVVTSIILAGKVHQPL